MKRRGLLRLVILLSAILLFTLGCGSEGSESAGSNGGKEKVFEFETRGIHIPMHGKVAPILENLGEEMAYFEAESCAFQGMERVYSYSGFELTTYEMEGEDYVASVQFLDDSMSTQEGIELSSSLEEVIQAYGEDYHEEFGLYTYELGRSKLSFLIEEDEVVSIEYAALAE